MALTIKELIQKNRAAHKQHFYIESVYLSYNLLGKVLRQVLLEEKVLNPNSKPKLSAYMKVIRSHYNTTPSFGSRLKRSVYKTINDFTTDFKTVNKELKYRYPEVKLRSTAQKGLNALVLLHTSMVKLRSNKNY